MESQLKLQKIIKGRQSGTSTEAGEQKLKIYHPFVSKRQVKTGKFHLDLFICIRMCGNSQNEWSAYKIRSNIIKMHK